MALKNLAVLETYLKDIIVSEEMITASGEMREHIFEIKDENKTLGFIALYDLKAYVFEHEEEAKHYLIKNIDGTEWMPIFKHPFFQRRKPQLISAQTLTNNDDSEFFILHKGQKIGPYERYELMEKIETREILLSDMVSFNGGHTWIKLFQVDGFDRRTLKDSDQLPEIPSNEFLNRPLTSVYSISEATDAITSLAFLGNLKKGKILEREYKISFQDEKDKTGKYSNSIYKWLFALSIIGIIYFLINIKSQLISPLDPTPENTIGEQAETLIPIEEHNIFTAPARNRQNNGINDQKRTEKITNRTLNPIRPGARKSFMETTKFKESTHENETVSAEDSNYYYDNSGPMELDPVRSQISKENFENTNETLPTNEPPPSGEPSVLNEPESLFTQEVTN